MTLCRCLFVLQVREAMRGGPADVREEVIFVAARHGILASFGSVLLSLSEKLISLTFAQTHTHTHRINKLMFLVSRTDSPAEAGRRGDPDPASE